MKHKRAVALLIVLSLVSLLALAGCSGGKSGDEFPKDPIELVIPAAAGGAADTFAREVANLLAKERIVDVPFVLSNKPGGSNSVAMKYVLSKPKDPYVVFSASMPLITGNILSADIPHMNEFTPIAQIAGDPSVWAVRADSPFQTLDDLLEASKSPNGITFAMGSVGATDHAFILQVEELSGGKMVTMPNSADNEAILQVLSGNADVVTTNPRLILGQVQAGEMRLLAITSEVRVDGIDAPTFIELGYDVSGDGPRGIVVSKDISDEAKAYYLDAFTKLVETESWKTFLKDNYLSPTIRLGDDYADFLQERYDTIKPLFEKAGLAG